MYGRLLSIGMTQFYVSGTSFKSLSMTKLTITFTQYKFRLFSTDSLIYLVTLTQKGLQYLVSRKSERVENILKTCVQVCYL